jgi:hypothetical protein
VHWTRAVTPYGRYTKMKNALNSYQRMSFLREMPRKTFVKIRGQKMMKTIEPMNNFGKNTFS